MFWVAVTGIMLSATAVPVDVILDTDLGDDIDDTWALCQMLGTPEINTKLIVTAAHNTPLKTRLVAKILESIGRTDVPLGMGKKTADKSINQAEWLGEYSLDDYKGVVHEDGVQTMIDMVMSAEKPITICAIGPVTNLAEALRREPRIAEKARVVLMAGSIHIGYGGKPEPAPEWNVVCDVESSKAVFSAPWAITIAPLDSCGTLQLQGEDYAKVTGSESAAAKTIVANYDAWANRKHYAKDSTSVLFDTVAIYLIHADEYLEMETLPLVVDDKGMTVIDQEKGRPVHCALGWKDETAFKAHLIETITK
jgi:inosine-uridine nucleoside N-ribohydrolase